MQPRILQQCLASALLWEAGGKLCAANFRRGGPAKRVADIDKFIMLGGEWIVESGVCEW